MHALHRELVLRRLVGDQRARSGLAARARGRRHLHQRDAAATVYLFRPDDIHAVRHCPRDDWLGHIDIVAAEQSAFTGVRIKRP